MESIILISNNVQAKGKTSITIKTCDLIITSERIICVPVGGSTMIAGMIGNAIAGPSGAIAFALDAKNTADKKSNQNAMKKVNELLKDPEAYSISLSEINPDKSTFKTGFFSTLGMWAPLTVYDNSGTKFFFNVPNGQKGDVKEALEKATNNIKLK